MPAEPVVEVGLPIRLVVAADHANGLNVVGLIIKSPHIDRILAGEKTWEIRGGKCHKRETIARLKGGSGKILGTCEIIDCLGPLSLDEMHSNTSKHCIQPGEFGDGGLPYPKTYAWVLEKAQTLPEPLPYKHPTGAVIWVTLDDVTVPAGLDSLRM